MRLDDAALALLACRISRGEHITLETDRRGNRLVVRRVPRFNSGASSVAGYQHWGCLRFGHCHSVHPAWRAG
jgi:hypothetical protein